MDLECSSQLSREMLEGDFTGSWCPGRPACNGPWPPPRPLWIPVVTSACKSWEPSSALGSHPTWKYPGGGPTNGRLKWESKSPRNPASFWMGPLTISVSTHSSCGKNIASSIAKRGHPAHTCLEMVQILVVTRRRMKRAQGRCLKMVISTSPSKYQNTLVRGASVCEVASGSCREAVSSKIHWLPFLRDTGSMLMGPHYREEGPANRVLLKAPANG